MNPAAADPLAGLRGYRLPEAVAWWPPAPGWWLLGLMVLVLLGLGIGWLLRRRRRRAAARLARAELAGLAGAYRRDGDGAALARGLSRLLRRFALVRFPPRQVAGLTGTAWLAFLDAQGGGERFRDGPGRLLLEAPYRQAMALPGDELLALAGDWIERNAEARP